MKKMLYFIFFSKTILFFAMISLYAHPDDTIPRFYFNEVKNLVEFNKGFISEPVQLLSGKVPGLSISKKGSDPNVFNGIYVRGNSSHSSDGLLYIIDGVWDADPQFLVPHEIESIEIMKDAVSTAKYGSRGMMGVIIINTKSSPGNKPFSLEFDSYLALNTVAKRMDLLSAEELRSFVNRNNLLFNDGGTSTDWQDEILRNTLSQNYHLSTYGKLKNTGYRLSFNHRDYSGIVMGTGRSNTGLSLNLAQQALNGRLRLNANAGIRYVNSNSIPGYRGTDRYNIFYQTYQRNPTDPVYEADGKTYAQFPRTFQYNNPLAIINYTNNETSSSLMNYSFNSDYAISKGLSLFFNAGHSASNTDNNRFLKPEAVFGGTEGNESGYSFELERLNINPGIKYTGIISNKHRVSLQAEFIYRMVLNKYSYWYKDTSQEYTDNSYTKPKYNSVIASVWYEYNERFFLNAFWNREAYSLISSQTEQMDIARIKRTNHYPSLVAGWKIHNETFMKRFEVLSQFVLKGGFGYSGNNNFHLIDLNPQFVNTDDLETERMNELSVGLDYGFWNNRFTGSFVYYTRNSTNILGRYSVPVPPNPYPFVFKNVYHYKNNGVELSLNALAFQNEKLRWNTSIVYFRNRNELVSGMNEENGLRWGYLNYSDDTSYTQLFRTGSSTYVFYLPVLVDISPDGFQRYLTETGTLTRDIYSAKREEMEQLTPRQEMGWVNRFSFMQGFDFEISLRYVEGHSIFNATRMVMSSSFRPPVLNVIPEGVNNYEIGKQNNAVCDFYLENASYLRLDYITLGYSINPKFSGINANLRLYLSANNLLTVTKYSGLDPSYDYSGIDYFNVYPLARSFLFGVRLSI
jgi:TonB-dependent starch-binding outer membrane protein SusC